MNKFFWTIGGQQASNRTFSNKYNNYTVIYSLIFKLRRATLKKSSYGGNSYSTFRRFGQKLSSNRFGGRIPYGKFTRKPIARKFPREFSSRLNMAQKAPQTTKPPAQAKILPPESRSKNCISSLNNKYGTRKTPKLR